MKRTTATTRTLSALLSRGTIALGFATALAHCAPMDEAGDGAVDDGAVDARTVPTDVAVGADVLVTSDASIGEDPATTDDGTPLGEDAATTPDDAMTNEMDVVDDTPTSDVDAATRADARADTGTVTDAGTVTDSGTVSDAGTGTSTRIACPSGQTEVFRDDFDGTSLDTTRWSVTNGDAGGGVFTQLTHMLAVNVTVGSGHLSIASHRHCRDPWDHPGEPAHPADCGATNYYSGGWLRTRAGYAPGHGLMIYRAKLPAAVQGYWPGVWARNTQSGANYGEIDLYENWWDVGGRGRMSDQNRWNSTYVFGADLGHSNNNTVAAQTNVTGVYHVWEVEWDTSVSPAAIRYYYRSAPGAARVLTRTITAQTAGLSGALTEAQFRGMLNDTGCTGSSCGWRPYLDFAVQPDTQWHIGPDNAPVYDPAPMEIDAVVVCRP